MMPTAEGITGLGIYSLKMRFGMVFLGVTVTGLTDVNPVIVFCELADSPAPAFAGMDFTESSEGV